MAASMKMRAFWDIAPCSLAGVYHCFRGAYCLHHQGDNFIVLHKVKSSLCPHNRFKLWTQCHRHT